ncbi:hypothetical protein BM1_00753 [Bipolaris maydis]|nr:hypothetical protein BM1_00753 [Bipolaris maydis]
MHTRTPKEDRLNRVSSLVIWCQIKPVALGSNNSASSDKRPRAVSGSYVWSSDFQTLLHSN